MPRTPARLAACLLAGTVLSVAAAPAASAAPAAKGDLRTQTAKTSLVLTSPVAPDGRKLG